MEVESVDSAFKFQGLALAGPPGGRQRHCHMISGGRVDSRPAATAWAQNQMSFTLYGSLLLI